MKLFINQNLHNDQKKITKFSLVQTKHFFRIQTIKQYSLSEGYYQTRVNTFSELISNITDKCYSETILHTFPDIKQY